ncbi:hypothetical protein [Nonomuraea rubra]|uniref:hypothetical protein n=1 Tax=Nonomuraea rubra TaxID=46180 RepID=UPI0031E7D53E
MVRRQGQDGGAGRRGGRAVGQGSWPTTTRRELAVVFTRGGRAAHDRASGTLVFVLPETPSLRAPTVADLADALRRPVLPGWSATGSGGEGQRPDGGRRCRCPASWTGSPRARGDHPVRPGRRATARR